MTHVHLPKRTLTLLFALCMAALVAMPASAQRVFLQLDGIEGEATDRDHRGWIDVLSVSYEWAKPTGAATGQSRRRGSVTYGDIVVVKEIDASTPLLINALARGMVTRSATLHVMRGSAVVLTYELTNVLVSSHSMKDGKEHVSMSFESMTITHPASSREVTVDTSQGR